MLRASAWLIVMGITATALGIGAHTIWASMAKQPQFRLNPRALSLNGFPQWVQPEPMAAELHKELIALPAGASIFTQDLAYAVQRELRSSPWVLDVTRVQRKLPNRLVVGAVFRKPAGRVFFRGESFLVDEDGHWLPDLFFSPPPEWNGENTPSILDRNLEQPPPVGQAWDYPAIAVGARLTEFFRANGLFNQLDLTTIDVTGVGQDDMSPEVVLTAVSGAQVKWGKSSVYKQVRGLRPPAAGPHDVEKLQMLLDKLRDYPNLRGLENGYMDLRYHGKIAIYKGSAADSQ